MSWWCRLLGNVDDLLKAVVEKLEQRHCSNLGTFSTFGVNGILFGHGGMLGVVDSEICSMVDFFAGGLGYGNDADNMLRSTQPVLLTYMQATLSQKYNGCIVV